MSVIIAVVVLAGLFIYLIHQGLEYARQKEDRARLAQAAQRRAIFRPNAITMVDDPREAGITILHMAAGPQPSTVQLGAMEWIAREMMNADAPQALVARGRWLARQVVDPVRALDHLMQVLAGALTEKESMSFADAVSEVAKAEGAIEDERQWLVRRLAAGLGVHAHGRVVETQ